MSKLIEKIFGVKIIRDLSLNLFVYLDNFSYKVLTKLAIIDNSGTHPKHKILGYHKFFKDNIEQGDRIVDIGCGKGENAYDISSKAKQVIAIDIREKSITYAKEHYTRENLEYIVGDVLTYNFENKFDKIVFSNVLEHIKDRVAFLRHLHNVSDVILLRVPMIDRDWLTVYKKEKGFEYRLDPTHYIEYTMDELRKELAESSWEVEKYSIQFGECWAVLKNKTYDS